MYSWGSGDIVLEFRRFEEDEKDSKREILVTDGSGVGGNVCDLDPRRGVFVSCGKFGTRLLNPFRPSSVRITINFFSSIASFAVKVRQEQLLHLSRTLKNELKLETHSSGLTTWALL